MSVKPFTVVALLGAGPADTPILLCAVQRVMSGLTASGPGPNCEIDVMGHKQPPALQKGSQEVGPRRDATRSHTPQAAVACCPYSGSEA